MLILRPYNQRSYPPQGRWPEFGDAIMEHAFDLAAESQGKLAAKRERMDPFHIQRLEDRGYFPLQVSHPSHHATPARQMHDIQQEAVENFDHNPRPLFLQHHTLEEFHEPSEGTITTISPYNSPRGENPWGTTALDLAGQGASAAAAGAAWMGDHAVTAFKHNVMDTVEIAKTGFNAAGHVVKAVGNASRRAASASKEHLYQIGGATSSAAAAAIEPGSNTRRAIAGVAGGASDMAGSVAAGAKEVLKAAGPPLAHGGYAVASGAVAGASGLGRSAIRGAGVAMHSAGLVADATMTHVVPAVQALAKHSMSAAVSMASKALDAATLSAGDILSALAEMQKEERYSAHNALENGHHEALGNGSAPARKRGNTPPRSRNTRSAPQSSAAASRPKQEHSYNSAQEWLEYSHNRGVLVEELYKRPNWKQFITSSNTPELRKKLLGMSAYDLAEILMRLDHM